MIAQAYAYCCEADVHGTRNSTRTYLELALSSSQQISVSWLLFIRGWAYYQANRLEEAETDFQRVSDLRDSAHVRNVVDSITGLALIYGTRGEQEAARSMLDDLRQFVVEQGAVSICTPDSRSANRDF